MSVSTVAALRLRWDWRARWSDVDRDAIYDALALRGRVFVVEQGPYADADGLDRRAGHLLGRDAGGELVAYLRVVDAGAKYAEPSLGRVAVAAAARGHGVGRALVAEGLHRCTRLWPGRGVRISAQSHLEAFYAGFGFVRVGADYLEDAIPHVEMLRAAEAP